MAFTLQDQSFAEDRADRTYATRVVRDQTGFNDTVSLNALFNGTADGGDFGFIGQNVTFTGNNAVSDQTITFTVNADRLTEGTETFGIRFVSNFTSNDVSFSIADFVRPANDNFANAQVVSIGSYGATTINASVEAGEPNAGNAPADPGTSSIWYSFTPTTSGRYFISSTDNVAVTIGGNLDPVGYVYTLTNPNLPVSFNNLTARATDDDSGGGNNFRMVIDASANTSYYVQARLFSGAEQGTFILNIAPESSGVFSTGDVSITEGDTLSQTGFFTITRPANPSAAVVTYAIAPGGQINAVPATAGVDYSAPTRGSVAFAANQTSATVAFTVIGDTAPERNEQFAITLTGVSNSGMIGTRVGTATIVDNDVPVGATAQFGTAGNDTLIAQTPGAILVGGAGNDTFLVYNQGAAVVEDNGGGTDIVYTVGSYNLGSNEVEALSTSQQTDATDINLTGNYVSQTIVGNYGNNILNGGSGADTLIGLFGNDTYAVGDSRIVIQEQAGQGSDILVTSVDYVLGAGVSIETFVVQDRASTAAVNLTGNEIAQTIVGSEGANVIDGGAGSDTLIGFGGADTFAFTTALGASNVDTIVDFTAGSDRIALGSSIFAAIGTTLDASEFVTGTAATTASQFIVYNAATGALFYDADGSGAGAAVQFAAIAPNTALTAAMFTVV